MNIEKEVRYEISKQTISRIIELTKPYKPRTSMLDIVFGYYGQESLQKQGYICRIRQKADKKTMEVKKQTSDGWLEQEIALNDLGDGINYLQLIGMKPNMFFKRFREVRLFKGLKIFIDEMEILGDYVEIEYQDSLDAKQELSEFLNIANITGAEQDLYGSIVKARFKTDPEFTKTYTAALNNIINEYCKN